MSRPLALHVENLGKRFKLYSHPWLRLVEWLTAGRAKRHSEFWAVRHVSFELHRGDFLGIIGVNGAGKSTLLKMITGVLPSTEGQYTASGRILSLLEIGIGLQEVLSGRQNVNVNTQLLGFPPGYAAQRMAQIKDFSELGDFFDRPVATYSTGMRMRLAFALFAFLECDVLVLDEVMAVGDIFFQQKCYQRLSELIAQQTAIILVTHDLNAIQHYCRRVLVLHQGRQLFQGEVAKAIKTYIQARQVQTVKSVMAKFTPPIAQEPFKANEDFFWPADEVFSPPPPAHLHGSKSGRLVRLALCNQRGQLSQAFKQGETAMFCFEFELKQSIGVPVSLVEITNPYNILIHGKNSAQLRLNAPDWVQTGQRVRFCQRLWLGLQPGDYTFSLGLLTLHPDEYVQLENLSQDEFNQKLTWVCRVAPAGAFAVIFGLGHGLALTHSGLADLPGSCQVQVTPSTNSIG